MKFWKMNGAGNDFIIVNNIEEKIPTERFSDMARILCERHLSIGADGFMAVEKTTDGVDADFKMLFFNADGSMGEMCGNGARCICRYGYENGLSGETQRVETTAGIVTGRRIDRRMYQIRLNDPTNLRLDEQIEIDGEVYNCSYVELGDPGIPHCVVHISGLRDFSEIKLKEIGRKLRNYEGYPKGANVNFYEIIESDHIFERTYERGVEDFTYACGTGTGSLVSILTLKGEVSGKAVRVDVRGGTLLIDIDRNGDEIRNIYLTGPTNVVAKGEITDEELQ